MTSPGVPAHASETSAVPGRGALGAADVLPGELADRPGNPGPVTARFEDLSAAVGAQEVHPIGHTCARHVALEAGELAPTLGVTHLITEARPLEIRDPELPRRVEQDVVRCQIFLDQTGVVEVATEVSEVLGQVGSGSELILCQPAQVPGSLHEGHEQPAMGNQTAAAELTSGQGLGGSDSPQFELS